MSCPYIHPLTSVRLQRKCCPSSLFDILIFFDTIWYHTPFSWLINVYNWSKACVEVNTHLARSYWEITISVQKELHAVQLNMNIFLTVNWIDPVSTAAQTFSIWKTKMPSALKSMESFTQTTKRCWMTKFWFIIEWNIHFKYRFSTSSVYPIIYIIKVKVFNQSHTILKICNFNNNKCLENFILFKKTIHI